MLQIFSPNPGTCTLNWKGGNRPPEQKYESRKGVILITQGNTDGFRGELYNCGKYGHMAGECPETRKEEGGKYGQTGGDAQIRINLVEEDIYIYAEDFELLSIGVKEKLTIQKKLTPTSQG